jgi:hypothetical protein
MLILLIEFDLSSVCARGPRSDDLGGPRAWRGSSSLARAATLALRADLTLGAGAGSESGGVALEQFEFETEVAAARALLGHHLGIGALRSPARYLFRDNAV